MKFEAYLNVIDEKQDIFCGVSDALWDEPELGFDEFRAVECMTAVLEREGFRVERCVAGMPTAFTASYGSGSPSVGILAEYDGLAGMSQAPCVAEQQSIPAKIKITPAGTISLPAALWLRRWR